MRAGYRSWLIGRHVAYYTLVGNAVRIVRVLHQQQDPDSHL
ncbi:MAG: type II toxin-antitoxin system RelE/ParE family toxin [Gammaproteobacteria bacterium]|nr:type II toxin-antitoxin system RelE/ParE family toxin [Gammaproteobacteria bacterium]